MMVTDEMIRLAENDIRMLALRMKDRIDFMASTDFWEQPAEAIQCFKLATEHGYYEFLAVTQRIHILRHKRSTETSQADC